MTRVTGEGRLDRFLARAATHRMAADADSRSLSYSWDRERVEHPPLYGWPHILRCHLAEEPEHRAHPQSHW